MIVCRLEIDLNTTWSDSSEQGSRVEGELALRETLFLNFRIVVGTSGRG